MPTEILSEPPSTSPTPPIQNSDRFSPLSKVPLDIAYHRNLIFSLETPVQFDQVAWEKYWPYVDNVWCVHTKHDSICKVSEGKVEKFWGGCRLERKWDHGRVKSGVRKRKRREMGQCQAKFRLTLLPSGIRILERGKESHSHDLDYIDSVKRNSGIRGVVTDPFFFGWEPAGILAFLKDPTHHVSGHDLLTEGGGKYLERREILNVFTQTLRKAYPNLDPQAIKEAKDKYQGMKTCNFKGCNKAFPDSKALAQHRKTEHEERKHDHSDKLYTCPNKTCHRRKRSKGFATLSQLREHQIRMQHWGHGIYHGEGGPRTVDAVTDTDTLPADTGADVTAAAAALEQVQTSHPGMGQLPASAVMQHHMPAPVTDMSMMSLMAGDMEPSTEAHHLMPLDPSMQVQTHHHAHHGQVPDADEEMAVMQQRQDMMNRLQQLEMEKARMEQEMQRLRSALFVG